MAKNKGPDKKIVLGLTGSFGSGKSTVAAMFKSLGAAVVDADDIAHRIIKPRTETYKRIARAFGEKILKKDKTIDRVKLAKTVFDDPALLYKLNCLTHPEIIRLIKQEVKNSSGKVTVVDAPLLIEAGLKSLADKIIVVTLSLDKQVKRIKARNTTLKKDILKRIRSQIPLAKKIRLADFVIDNNQTMRNTKAQVLDIWEQLFIARK